MSRQCRFYLLPSDVERLLSELRLQVDLKLVSKTSTTLNPTYLSSPFSEYLFEPTKTKFIHLNCFLIESSQADIKMKHLTKRGLWMIAADPSEVIELSGCDYSGGTLKVGRLYFHNDQLIGDHTICPKRKEFIEWADRILRTTKKMLRYSKELYAYVGKDAALWEKSGGSFKEI